MGTVVLVTVLVALGFGVRPQDVVQYVVYLALCVAFPGVFVWRLLLRRLHTTEESAPTWFEDLSLGTIFGFGLQLPVFLLGVAVGRPRLVVVLAALLVVALSLATRGGRRVWALPTRRIDIRAAWTLAALAAYGNLWLWRERSFLDPLHLPGNKWLSIDETFHQALISELAHRFPPQMPYLAGTGLDYHWFVHAQIAATKVVALVEPTVMLRVVMPIVMFQLTILGLGAVALRLTGRPMAAFIAPALLTAGAYHLFGPEIPSFHVVDTWLSARFLRSPSQSYGVMMSLPAVMLILEVLRPRGSRHWTLWLTLGLSLLALAGSKATFLPVYLCGAIAVWGVILITRRRVDAASSLLVVMVAGAFAFGSLVILGGRTGGMLLDPLEVSAAAANRLGLNTDGVTVGLMTVALLLAWLLIGAGAVGLGRKRLLDPRVVWIAVSVAAGVTVPFVFHRNLSELWFSRSVVPLVALVSAWGLARLLPDPLTTREARRFASLAWWSAFLAFLLGLYLASAREAPQSADMTSLVITILAPPLLVLAFLVARLVIRRVGRDRPGDRGTTSTSRGALQYLLVVLVSLSAANALALAYASITEPKRPNPGVAPMFAAGGAHAAWYVKRHSSAEDLVATNMHCATPGVFPCDVRHFWLAALSERRVLIEGWAYTAIGNEMTKVAIEGGGMRIPESINERYLVNNTAFERPSLATVNRLVDGYGVSWLVVHKGYPADLAGLDSLPQVLRKVHENSNYVVYQVID